METNDRRQPTQYNGKKALILKGHPHADKVATCVGAEVTLVGPGLVFKDKDDYEFFIFKPTEIKWI